MASIVINSTADNQRMYCHNCSLEFIKCRDELFECPSCNQGFVEDVIDDIPPNQDLDNRLESFVSRLSRQQELMRSYMTRHLNASDSITAIAARVDEVLRPRSMTEAQLQEIPKVTITEEHMQIQCAVCFDNFTLNEIEVRQLRCSHLFHEKCIFPWVQNNGTCPVCRALLPNASRDDDTTLNTIDEYITEMENIISNLIGATPIDSSHCRVEREETQNNNDGQINHIQGPASSTISQQPTAQHPRAEESSLDYASHNQVIHNSSADDLVPNSEAIDESSSGSTSTEYEPTPDTNELTSQNSPQRKRTLDKVDIISNKCTNDDDDNKKPSIKRRKINNANSPSS